MKIALVAVGTRGDVQPHIALGTRLRKRGFQVTLVAPLDFREQAQQWGLSFHAIQVRFRQLLDSERSAALLASDGRPFRFLSVLKHVAFPIVERIIADIQDACRSCDAVCYSPLGIPAHFVARERGIPSFTTSLQPLGRTRAFAAPLFPLNGRTPGAVNRFTYFVMEQAFWQLFRPFMRRGLRLSLPVWSHFDRLYSASQPMLFGYSALVVPRPSDWTPSMHATGYWTLPEDPQWTPPPALAAFLDDGSPPVCVGFGSMHTPRIEGLLETCLLAIRRLERRAVVLTGWSGASLPSALLDERVFVVDAAPHGWLFPRCAAVIHHGGAGTVAAACRAGVPSVVLPFFFDQSFWGNWLRRRSLGPTPLSHRGLSASALVAALAEALDSPSVHANLASLSEALRAEDGAERAASVIEATLGR